MDLTKMKCIPCEGGIPALDKNDTDGYLKHIQAEWTVSPANRLTREFSFNGFIHGMDFVNRVADLAEEEGHHPVMHVFYSKVITELWTHALLSAGLSVYPNPTFGSLSVEAVDGAVGTQFYITDLVWRKIAGGELDNELTTIDISYLAKGTYLIGIIGQKRRPLKPVKF